MTNPPLSRDITRITLSVLFIGLLLAASFWIIRPFLLALIWAITIVVATSKRGSPAGRVNPRRSPAVRPRGTTGLVSPRAE